MPHNMAVLGIFSKYPKNARIVRQFSPPECVSEFSFCLYHVAFFIGYIVVYSIFVLGAVLEDKFAKQNGYFEEFLYSNVIVKYYRIQWLLEEKNISEKAPNCWQSVLSL